MLVNLLASCEVNYMKALPVSCFVTAEWETSVVRVLSVYHSCLERGWVLLAIFIESCFSNLQLVCFVAIAAVTEFDDYFGESAGNVSHDYICVHLVNKIY
jgi:hypothetical protein